MTVTVHTAAAVVPVTAPIIHDGAIAVQDGFIAGVGRRDDVVGHWPGAERVAWSGVITPGLVNAHTHLQYTSFAEVGASPSSSYVAWAERFVREYSARRAEDWRATARAGLVAGLASGTTCFGDVVTDADAMDVLVTADVAGVAYYEIIGEPVGDVERVLRHSPRTDATRVGLSPHAPYSVDEAVIREFVALARRLGLRIHSHVAEIPSEDELYRSATGAWAERVRTVVRRPRPLLADGAGVGTVDFAERCRLLGPDSHLAHGVYLDREDRRRLTAAGTYLALCPRSNITVGSDPPPIADILHERALFAVGTDSLASNRSLDLLTDVIVLRNLAREHNYDGHDLDARLFAAATLGGAQALGLGDLVGSLEFGKRADFAVWEVDSRDPVHALVTSGGGVPVSTFTAGRQRPGPV